MTQRWPILYVFRNTVLPSHLQESLDAYVTTGQPLGGFLAACVQNNLASAINLADEANLPLIPAIVGYLFNECPSGCWGCSKKYVTWLSIKSIENHERTD